MTEPTTTTTTATTATTADTTGTTDPDVAPRPLTRDTVPRDALLVTGPAPSTGIVHLGLSNFHRAHLAVATARAVAVEGGAWGVWAYSLRSEDVPRTLREQDLLYSVVEIAPGSDGVVVPAIHTAARGGSTDPWEVVAKIGKAETRIISITVTEAGYSISPRTGGLDVEDPTLQADLAGAAPRTVIGLIARGLLQRARSHGEPVTVLSCDNLATNGDRTGALVHDFADALPDADRSALLGYLATSVSFPNSMVDRIVPQTTDAHRDLALARLGVADRAPVPAEPFTMWVIEDDFAGGRPAWEVAGVVFTPDVEAYELMKLRLLNGTHSLLAYVGALAGCATIPAARATPWIEAAARGVLAEYRATLTIPAEVDGDAYVAQLFDRWSNTVLGHRTSQVGSDGSVKLPQRVTEPLHELTTAGWTPPFIALTIAAYLACLAPLPGSDPGEHAAAMTDPARERLAELGATSTGPDDLVRRFLGGAGILPPSLADLPGLADAVARSLTTITTAGVRAAVDDALAASARPTQEEL